MNKKTEPRDCQHEIRQIAANTRRCQNCGHEETEFTPKGVSFAQLAEPEALRHERAYGRR